MSAITYTAKRYLAPGHVFDTQYSIDVKMQSINDDEEKHLKKAHRSISGKTETWLQRIDRYVTFKTVPIDESTNLYFSMREFLSSVAGGESFVIDSFGSVASPNNPQTYILESVSPAQRIKTLHYKTFSFKARLVNA